MRYGLIGEKLPHSFSKEIHEKLGRYEYELIEIERESLGSFIKKKDFAAINVTIPYKEAVIPYLDGISDEAEKIGAVNVIINRSGKLFGYNTDFLGMKNMLKWGKIDLYGKKVLVLGTGGTSKTASAVAASLGAKSILRVSRTPSVGEISYETATTSEKDADIIINTTPVGMFPRVDESPISLEAFTALSGVVDVIYNPLRTRLINSAKRLGLPSVSGLYMLVSQAVLAAELFLGESLPEGTTEKIYSEILCEKENIILVGMPGCGKTTLGEMLSKKLGKSLFDSDSELEKQIGNVGAFIKSEGEGSFRAKESEVIKSLSLSSGAVISTGGGAVLRSENVERLSQNGRIYFIDRDISLILPTESRPLSSDRASLEKRYSERYGIYMSSKDRRIENNASPEAALEEIIKDFHQRQ